MSEGLNEAGNLMRLGVAGLLAPVLLLVTMFFLWEGMYLYAGLMVVFDALISFGVYMNWKRVASDEKIDDDRMQKINWKSGFNAFWTVLNTSIILWLFKDIVISLLKISEATFHEYNLLSVVTIGFVSYFAFRTYYLKTGVETEFWRLN